MIYEWRCEGCGRVTEVMRPMSMSDVPPMRCEPVIPRDPQLRSMLDLRPACESSTFIKKVSLPSRLQVDSGREGHVWPLRNPHLREPDGTIPVFQNKRELDTYLARTGQVLLADGYDNAVGPSQRSVYDQIPSPPPTPEAAAMLARSAFVDEVDVEGDDDPIEVSSGVETPTVEVSHVP